MGEVSRAQWCCPHRWRPEEGKLTPSRTAPPPGHTAGMRGADAFGVAWYRFRCTWGERWAGYLALVLLIGLVGGLAIGSLAAARRTQAAFPAYLASTNPSDLTVLSGNL